MEGVRPQGECVGPLGGVRAYLWDTDAIQGIASVKVNVLGNITMWTQRNPDLVEYTSVANIGELRS